VDKQKFWGTKLLLDGINNASSVCVNSGDENLTIDFGYYLEPVIYMSKIIGYWKNHPDAWS
jgi:hypothetical protein